MQRYNSFNNIHKALRSMLYDTALCLQQTDFENNTETDEALQKVITIVQLFEEHAHNEDNFILPALETFDPSVTDCFRQEHVMDMKLSEELNEAINHLYAAEKSADKTAKGRALTQSFINFMVFNLNHMAKEEDVLNKLLWQYYTDKEIKEIENKIVSNTPPEKQPLVAKWMVKGISNNELVHWLKEVEQHAPEPVFKMLFSVAEHELTHKRFRQVIEKMTGGLMAV